MCHSSTVQESNYSTQNIENAAFLGTEVIAAIRSKKKKKSAVAEEEEANKADLDDSDEAEEEQEESEVGVLV